MALHLVFWQTDAILEDEWQYRHNETVEKEISKKADADSTDDEKCAGAPGKTYWL